MHDPRKITDRRRAAALAGHHADAATARAGLTDPDAVVRALALAAVHRAGALTATDMTNALRDPDAAVRRRACEVAGTAGAGRPAVEVADVLASLDDPEPAVAEAAAWCLGELGDPSAVAKLCNVVTGHDDALVREAAVAALGALGDPAGLPAILSATTDKPAVRRRAVLALAPFEGTEVDAALARAKDDRDWQVREAAELLLRSN